MVDIERLQSSHLFERVSLRLHIALSHDLISRSKTIMGLEKYPQTEMIGGLTGDEIAGVVMLLGVIPASFIVWYTWSERHKPGVPWFILAMVAGIGWAITSGLNPLIVDPALSQSLYNLNVFIVSLAAVCWFLLAIEYTHDVRLSVRAFLILTSLPLLAQVFLWTNASHGLMYTMEQDLHGSVLQLTPEPLWYLQTGYNYLLVVMGAGMWLGEWVSTTGTRRRQTELFLLATLVLLGTGSLLNMIVVAAVETTAAGVVGPLAFILAGGVIAYALTEYELFRLTPVARETVIQEMDDGVVIVDDEGQIVDTNETVRRLFEFDQPTTAVDARDLFEQYPAMLEQLTDPDDKQTELRLTVDGVERDVDMNVTPIDYGRGGQGQVVVFREITSLKQRQRDLDLAKRVLSRVFRHNVRNDMTAIRGYAEIIAERDTDEVQDYARAILEQSDKLLAQSEKTRLIADVIDAEDAVIEVDLAAVVEDAVRTVRTETTAGSIDVCVDSSATVRAHRKLSRAIEQLVENAIQHQEGTPQVSIETERDGVRIGLVVEDEGPGIPESEIRAVLDETESDLKHGSGVGLWLAKWIVEYSGGELTFENTGTGTRVILWLEPLE